MRIIIALTLLSLLYACEPTTPATDPTTAPAAAPSEPYADRVAAAERRLSASPAGLKVQRAIDAHGGLARWYRQGPLHYHFNYQPTEADKTVRNSYILNDYVNARAVHHSADQEGMTYGFDGEKAWKHPADADLKVKPRFWSLTPYYFVGLPFVLADEGISFELMDNAEWEGTNYERVKVTYGDGVGDAPDDYYVLWLNPTTGQLDALNYIVSYPGFFPDGGHLPEKLMVLTGKTTVDGITLPTGYTTRWSDKPTEVITNITVDDYEFRPDMDDDAFAMPADAAVTE